MRETVKGTSVAYHSEGFGRGARPAINVKVYSFDRAAFGRLAANPAIGEREAESLFDYATSLVAESWWEDAANSARDLGLGEIEQEGRMGGWLVFTDGRDPLDMGGKKRLDWLRAYSEMVQWCADSLALVPAEIGKLATEYATQAAVAP